MEFLALVSWGSDPQVKVEAGAVNISNDHITGSVHRLENAISRAHFIANDYEGKNFIANLDAFTVIKVSFRYGADAWEQVFEGTVAKVGPKLDDQGQTVDAVAYGYGRALTATHCDSNYGNESENRTIDTPNEVWDDLVDNMINKSFGGAATGYAITKTKLKNIVNPTIEFLEGGYRNNLTLLNDTLKIYQGYRDESAGLHWFVDPSKNLWVDTIGAHTVDVANWPTWWRTDQAGSTLTEGVDLNRYYFHKKTDGFANKILLYCNFRKPGTDVWTEDGGPVWGTNNLTATYDAGQFVVGSHSLKLVVLIANTGYAYHPSTQDAGWDLTKCGSLETIPKVNFYFRKDPGIDETDTAIRFFTTNHNADYFECLFSTWTDADNQWFHRSIPIGNFWKTADETREYRWTSNGAPDWTDINGICFRVGAGGETSGDLYIDDLHISGKIIREAYNSTSIAANDEYQMVMRYDCAVDDTLNDADDSGTAGYLAYGELLRHQTIPVVGTFTTPLAVDILPGQLIYIQADKFAAADYRVKDTFRVKEIIHLFDANGAFTTWDVTDDILNSFAVGFNDPFTAFHKVMFVDPEMKNLKTTELDPYVDRLSKDYP